MITTPQKFKSVLDSRTFHVFYWLSPPSQTKSSVSVAHLWRHSRLWRLCLQQQNLQSIWKEMRIIRTFFFFFQIQPTHEFSFWNPLLTDTNNFVVKNNERTKFWVARIAARSKGVPARESRTGTRLVSPAAGGKKKKRKALQQGLGPQNWVH